MVHIPRFARLFLLAAAVITLPTLYLFYPHEFSPSSDIDAGGIDQEHFREPVPQHVPDRGKHHVEDEEPRNNWEAVVFDAADGNKDSTTTQDGAAADKPKPPTTPADPPRKAHGNKNAAAAKAPGSDISKDTLGGGVIMPHLGNATAK